MSTQTPRLGLPLLAGGQAQKHIVVNDALLDIDHLVQARLSSRSVTAQPASPADGDLYMIPTGATGANWASFTVGQVVRYFDGFWYSLSHPEGTIIYVADEDLYLSKSVSGWVRLDSLITELKNLKRLGIGTVADSDNPLSAYLNSALLAAKPVSDGGTGDMRLTINKSAVTNIASLIFKNDFVAKAEIGLLGNDSFGLKVSNDGNAWVSAITVTAAGLMGIGTTTPAKKLDVSGSDALIYGMTLGRGNGDIASNCVLGAQVLSANTTGNANTAMGFQALTTGQTASSNVAIGYRALPSATSSSYNVALGREALNLNQTGNNNIAIGYLALAANVSGASSIAIGRQALEMNTSGSMLAVGYQALNGNTTGSANTALGYRALLVNTTAANNTAVGYQALVAVTTGGNNTALGYNAGSTNVTFGNTTCLGYQAQVTGADQVQLGNSTTTTYVYGTVQNRSDARDKADIRDTVLGLDFILGLRPVDYRLDMREDYRTLPPVMPLEGADEAQINAYHAAYAQWQVANRLGNIIHDGSHKRTRYHSGLIAQEVAEVVSSLGVNWGGVQDHSYNGGDEVMSLGYSQFIAPLIRAVQQLSERVAVLEGGVA